MRWTSVHHQNYHSGVKNQKYIRCFKYYTYYNFLKSLTGVAFQIIIHFFILKQVTNSPDQLLCLIVHQHASNSKGKETWTRIRDHWRKFGMEPTSNYYECCASTQDDAQRRGIPWCRLLRFLALNKWCHTHFIGQKIGTL